MNKQVNSTDKAAIIIFGLALSFVIMLLFVSSGKSNYSPMDSHIKYIQASHNDSCQYNMGECPQIECSHSSIK